MSVHRSVWGGVTGRPMFVWLNRVLSHILTHSLIGTGVKWHPTPVPKQTNTKYQVPNTMYIHKYLRGPEVFYWKFVHHIRLYPFLFEGEIHTTPVSKQTSIQRYLQVPKSIHTWPQMLTSIKKSFGCMFFLQLKWMDTRLLLLVKMCSSQFHWVSHFNCLAFSSNWQSLAFIQTLGT